MGLGVATALHLLRQVWLQKRWMHLWLVLQTVLLVSLSWIPSSGMGLQKQKILGGVSVSAWMVAFLVTQCLYLGAQLACRDPAVSFGRVRRRHLWAVAAAALGAQSLHVMGLDTASVVVGFVALAASHRQVLRGDLKSPTELSVSTAAWLSVLGVTLTLQAGLGHVIPHADQVQVVVILGMHVFWAWRVMALQDWRANWGPGAHNSKGELQERFDMQVQMERRNAESAAAREQAEQMALRQTEFLATMSHELRTPLACVVGLSRMLAANEEYGLVVRKDMGTVERLAVQLLRTVDDGLAFVRQESVPSEPRLQNVHMAHLLRDIKSLTTWLAQQQRNQVHFLRVRNIPARLCFDEQRVRQILVNLVSNAARYCQDGEITLGVAIRKSGELHMMEWLVEDTGRGMDEQEQKRFFDPFSKSRDSQGLGLGLALVKRLVHEIHGEINLQSVKEKGTRFRISIPVQLHDMNEHHHDLEEDADYPDPSTQESVPMALLPHDDLVELNLARLRQLVKLGQLSEIEIWLRRAKTLRGLGPESQRLLVKLDAAVKLVDLQGVQALIDQVDTPLSFV